MWQDAYVIKKSMKKYFLKKNIVKIRKKNWSNFKPQKLVQKLHDIEIKNNICIFSFLHVNMASRGLYSEPRAKRVETRGGWVFIKNYVIFKVGPWK